MPRILAAIFLLLSAVPAHDAPSNASQKSAPARTHVIVVPLGKKLDAKELNAGDTFGLKYTSWDPAKSGFEHLILRIVSASTHSKDSPESRLMFQFELLPAGSTSDHGSPLRLELQAVVAPSWVRRSFPIPVVIEDRFPCDPKVSRNGCEHDGEDRLASALDAMQPEFCNNSSSKNQPLRPNACVSPDDAFGVYGYPDLGLAYDDSSPNTSGLNSVKKNVKLEAETYLVLRGPDVEIVRRPIKKP